MAIHQLIPSFNAGELSPYLDARSDLEKYASGCRLLENFIIMPYGGVYRRPGTEYLGAAKKADKRCRLLGFNFSTNTRFVLEMGEYYIRFWSNGIQVEVEGLALEVTTPYGEGELRELQFIQINDVMYFVHPLHAPCKLTRLADDKWTFELVEWDWPTVLDDNISTITLTPSLKTGKGITLTASAPPWAASTSYKKGDFVSSSSTIYQAKSDHTSAVAFATDMGAGKWEKFEVFKQGNVGGYFQIGHSRTANFVERSISADGVSAAMVVLGDWELNTYGTWHATVHIERSYDNGLTWSIIRTYDSNSDKNVSSTGKEDRQSLLRIRVANYSTSSAARALLTAQEAKVFGFVKVTEFTSATVVVADVMRDLFDNTATTFWAEGAWSARQGFPRTIALHEQRIFYGGTESHPQSVWGSVINDFEMFRLYTADDAGLFFTLSAQQANPIQWLVSQSKLLIGTAGEEWTLASSDSNNTITPSSVLATRQSSYGSKYLRALVINDVILFAQRQGRKVRELVYSFEQDGYRAPDLTMLSEHVTKGEILECTFQQQPDAIYWTITGAGQLVGMTYERDQNVVGWHRHTTDGIFESVATIYGASGADEVWVAVQRKINGETVRMIERFKTDFRETFESEAKSDWWYLDCAKRVNLLPEGSLVSGLAHLEGKVVDILADGAVSPARTVDGGSISLQSPAGRVVVGLPFVSKFCPMKLETQMPDGSSRGRKRRISTMYASFYKSLGGEFSGDRLQWNWIYSREMRADMDDSPPVFTGDRELIVAGDYGRSADITIRQAQPLPLTILALTPIYDISA